MRTRVPALSLVLAALVLAGPAPAGAASLVEYPLPADMTRASALAFGGDGALWIRTIGGAFDGQPRDHGKLASLEPGSAAFETLETSKPDLTDMVTLPDGRIVMSQAPGFEEPARAV